LVQADKAGKRAQVERMNVAVDQVKSIPEVDLEKGQLGLTLLTENITKRVRHHLDTTGASNTVVPSFEVF
jgi:hypothetical protein